MLLTRTLSIVRLKCADPSGRAVEGNVCGHLLAEIMGLNPTRGMDVCLF
jgi:hypothetical protein